MIYLTNFVDPCFFHGHVHEYETLHREWSGDFHYHVMCKPYIDRGRGHSSWELSDAFDSADAAFKFAQKQSNRHYEIDDAKVDRYPNNDCRHCSYKVRIDSCEFDDKHPLAE